MRVAIVVAAALLLFACERGVDSPQPYGVGSNYGGPGHSYASSAGGSTFAVVPLDLFEMSGLPDALAADGEAPTDVFDLGFEPTAESDECLKDYEGWEPFCKCKYDPDVPEPADDFCLCMYLACPAEGEPHQTAVDSGGWAAACPEKLIEAGEVPPGTCAP